jgi:hypothetical protein
MIVLKMSAQRSHFCAFFQLNKVQKARKNGTNGEVLFPPKAEVTGSNPVGRATSVRGNVRCCG